MIFAGLILLACSGAFAFLASDGQNLFSLFWALVCFFMGGDAVLFGMQLEWLRRSTRMTHKSRCFKVFGPHAKFGLSVWRAGDSALHIGLQLWPSLGLKLNLSWYTMHPLHGPKTWPWWKLFEQRAVATNPDLPNRSPLSWNLWTYTRRGAWCNHFAIDRRTPAQRGLA